MARIPPNAASRRCRRDVRIYLCDGNVLSDLFVAAASMMLITEINFQHERQSSTSAECKVALMHVHVARPKASELMFHVYERSVHPELFQVYKEQDIWCDRFWAQVQICDAGHTVSFRTSRHTVTEIVTSLDHPLPHHKQVLSSRLRGSRDGTLGFSDKLGYDCSYHLETLDPEVFQNLHQEMSRDCDCVELSHRFSAGNRLAHESLSIIRTVAEQNSLLIHAVHTFPECSAVVRTQSLFELRK